MPTSNALSSLKQYPIILVCLAFILTACGGHGHSNTPANTIEFDTATNMPKDQTVVISEALLAEELTNAFQLALNSPNDNIALSIAGKIVVPLPIPPPVPPGSLFAGVDVAKTMTIKFVEDTLIYYEVSFEKDIGLKLGAKVPALPKDNEVSAGVTSSFSTKEVFRFDNPTDAAKGMIDYFLLQGVWRSMGTLNNLGIDGTDVAGFVTDFTSHVTAMTGLNFGLTASQLNKLLDAELLLLNFRQAEVDAAQAVLSADLLLLQFLQVVVDNAQDKLNSDQRVVDNWQARFDRNNCNNISIPNRNVVVCAGIITALAEAKSVLFLADAALTLAKLDLSIQQSIVSKAQDVLDQATVALNLVQNNIIGYQNALSALPPDTLVISFNDVVTQITTALDFLMQHHAATEVTISKASSFVAKADLLGGVNAKRTKSIGLKLNNDGTIAVAIKFTGERAVEAKLAIDVTDKGEVKKTNEIEYTLVLVRNSNRYKLEDKGTFKIEADLSGTLSRGLDILNRKVGAGIKPILEFQPGDGFTEFGENATGVIDLMPIIGIINNLNDLEPGGRELIDAVASTVQSFQIDELVNAISQQTLPLKIKFYRIAGIKSEISATKFLKGETSAAWNEYGDTLDLTNMTVADYVNSIFSGDGLTAKIDSLVTVIQNAHQESATIN